MFLKSSTSLLPKKKKCFCEVKQCVDHSIYIREVFKNTFKRKESVRGPTVLFISKVGDSIFKDICVIGGKKVEK